MCVYIRSHKSKTLLKAKSGSIRVKCNEEENGEVVGPLCGDQGQVGNIG